jgi:hypothetical protein
MLNGDQLAPEGFVSHSQQMVQSRCLLYWKQQHMVLAGAVAGWHLNEETSTHVSSSRGEQEQQAMHTDGAGEGSMGGWGVNASAEAIAGRCKSLLRRAASTMRQHTLQDITGSVVTVAQSE